MAWDDFSAPVEQPSGWDSFSTPVSGAPNRPAIKPREKDALDDPNMALKGMKNWEGVLAGAGANLARAGRALGLMDSSEPEWDIAKRDARLLDTTAGTVGNVVGDVAKYAPAALAATAASPILVPALAAGGIGAATTPGSVEKRAEAGAIDAATGALGGYALKGLGLAAKNIGEKVGPLSNARKAAGDIIGEQNVPAAIRILDNAPATVSAEQALVGMNNPNVANLASITRGLSPKLAQEYAEIQSRQAAARRAMVEQLVGAGNQTAAIDTGKAMKKAVSSVTVPAMERELAAANTAGIVGRQLQGEADRFGQAAASKVDDVRRISGAQQKAEELAQLGYGTLASNIPREVGMPRISGKYSYPGELTQVAERGAQQAADTSLPLGEAARFAQMQADSVAAHGLKPLDAESIVGAIARRIVDPTVRGNQQSVKVLSHVADVLEKEIAAGGGIADARALHDIRKTAVNDAVAMLARPGESAKATAKRAESLLTKVNPLIDRAIREAGGTAWDDALKAHALGMHSVDRQRMAAKALRALDQPNKFISLVEGNETEAVKKVFGPAKYDISKEMGPDIRPLKDVASQLKTEEILKSHRSGDVGKASYQAVVDAIKQDSWITRIPNMLSRPAMIANAALKAGESRANAKMMEKLAEAMDNPQALSALLKTLPLEQRSAVIRGFNRIAESGAPAVAGGALSDLVRQR